MICKEEKSKIAQNAGKDPRIVPSVDPEDEPEEEPTADDGGNSSIIPHVLGDATDMIPWALGFDTAVMLLGGAVALRRREE